MPQKLLRPIKLVEANIDALEQVRADGPCNMFDRNCVIRELFDRGHITMAGWCMDNPKCYGQLIMCFYEEVATEEEQDTDEKLTQENDTTE